MGFSAAKKAMLDCLREGLVQHAVRGAIDEKNLLLTGEVSIEEVAAFIRKCKGDQYEVRPHHILAGVDVHIFKPLIKSANAKLVPWYIKCYFLEPNVWFLSVHK